MENTFCDHKLERPDDQKQEIKNLHKNESSKNVKDVHNPVHIRIQEQENAIYYEIEFSENGEVFKTDLSAIENPNKKVEVDSKVSVKRSSSPEVRDFQDKAELTALELLDITLGILTKLLNLLTELSEVLGNYGNKEMSELDETKKDHKSNQKTSDEVIQNVPKKKRKRIFLSSG